MSTLRTILEKEFPELKFEKVIFDGIRFQILIKCENARFPEVLTDAVAIFLDKNMAGLGYTIEILKTASPRYFRDKIKHNELATRYYRERSIGYLHKHLWLDEMYLALAAKLEEEFLKLLEEYKKWGGDAEFIQSLVTLATGVK